MFVGHGAVPQQQSGASTLFPLRWGVFMARSGPVRTRFSRRAHNGAAAPLGNRAGSPRSGLWPVAGLPFLLLDPTTQQAAYLLHHFARMTKLAVTDPAKAMN